jgi:hypothetical protein
MQTRLHHIISSPKTLHLSPFLILYPSSPHSRKCTSKHMTSAARHRREIELVSVYSDAATAARVTSEVRPRSSLLCSLTLLFEQTAIDIALKLQLFISQIDPPPSPSCGSAGVFDKASSSSSSSILLESNLRHHSCPQGVYLLLP